MPRIRRCDSHSVSLITGLALACLTLPGTGQGSGLCGPWEQVSTPNVGNSVTRLTAVTALTTSEAWAVGYWRNQPAGQGPLVLRWEGSAWQELGLPSTGHLGTEPSTDGVDVTANGDVWVVGNVQTTYPSYNLPLVLRWREGNWDYVETVTLRPQTVYPYAPRGGFAYEVDALAPDDIWAVGAAAGFGDGGATSVPLAVHWDGSGWTEVDVPRVANRHHELGDVVAISHDDVWAVGDYRNVAGTYRGVTYHWDGEAWSHVHSPIEDMHQTGLEDVVATGPNDVWAIGGGDSGVILMHWDGSEWSLAEPPPNSGGSMAAVGPDDLWVSGWNGYWHWDGVSWTEVPASVSGASYVIRSGGMAIVGDCDIWCAGFWTLADGVTSFTLAERLQAGPTAADDRGTRADLGSNLEVTYPNPFRPGDQIRLAHPPGESILLTILDLQGRVRRRLSSQGMSVAGSESLAWDGRDDAGEPLPTGVYFLRMEARGVHGHRKVTLLATRR